MYPKTPHPVSVGLLAALASSALVACRDSGPSIKAVIAGQRSAAQTKLAKLQQPLNEPLRSSASAPDAELAALRLVLKRQNDRPSAGWNALLVHDEALAGRLGGKAVEPAPADGPPLVELDRVLADARALLATGLLADGSAAVKEAQEVFAALEQLRFLVVVDGVQGGPVTARPPGALVGASAERTEVTAAGRVHGLIHIIDLQAGRELGVLDFVAGDYAIQPSSAAARQRLGAALTAEVRRRLANTLPNTSIPCDGPTDGETQPAACPSRPLLPLHPVPAGRDQGISYIDGTGRMILRGYQLATAFVDGRAVVKGDGDCQLIDETGRVQCSFACSAAEAPRSGLIARAALLASDGRARWGLLDLRCQPVAEDLSAVLAIEDGRALVVDEHGVTLLLDQRGAVLMLTGVVSVGAFSSGLAQVRLHYDAAAAASRERTLSVYLRPDGAFAFGGRRFFQSRPFSEGLARSSVGSQRHLRGIARDSVAAA